ncbi:MAG: phosphotransferase enzyme family protein [Heyndrickxia sp.]
MMKLSTMKKVVETVDSEWHSPLAEFILNRWGFDEGSVYYFRSSANFIFLFKRNGATHFLRFNNSCERDIETIESELEILSYLQAAPIKVVKPIPSLNGKYIEEVRTEIGTFYAVVFEALHGKQFEIEELSSEQYFEWGKALGALHHILKRIPENLTGKRKHWLEQLSHIQEKLPESEMAAIEEIQSLKSWANSLQTFHDEIGLVHFDFELDNLRWEHRSIGILDFDDSSVFWYAADIVFALRELSEDGLDLENAYVKEFITGYKTETSLDHKWLKEFYMFERMHNIIMFNRLLRSVDIEISESEPEWLKNLARKLLAKIENYRQSFETNRKFKR